MEKKLIIKRTQPAIYYDYYRLEIDESFISELNEWLTEKVTKALDANIEHGFLTEDFMQFNFTMEDIKNIMNDDWEDYFEYEKEYCFAYGGISCTYWTDTIGSAIYDYVNDAIFDSYVGNEYSEAIEDREDEAYFEGEKEYVWN